MRAHRRNLANTTEASVCGGDATLCQITLTLVLSVSLLSIVLKQLNRSSGNQCRTRYTLYRDSSFPHTKTDVTPATKSRDFDARQGLGVKVASVTGRVARCVMARRTVARLVFGIQKIAGVTSV